MRLFLRLHIDSFLLYNILVSLLLAYLENSPKVKGVSCLLPKGVKPLLSSGVPFQEEPQRVPVPDKAAEQHVCPGALGIQSITAKKGWIPEKTRYLKMP